MASSSSIEAHWRSIAFGLVLEGDFDAPGLPATEPVKPLRAEPTHLALVGPSELDADWPADRAERLVAEHLGHGRPQRTIDFDPVAGYRLYARHFGLARVSADGRSISCAPPPVTPWRWQRFLVGRVLPFTAAVRGVPMLHASSAGIDGGAFAVLGSSGAGKTSVLVHAVLGGARFLCDDVVALEPSRGQLLAHPGSALAAVRRCEHARLDPASRRRLGAVLGRDEKVHVRVDRQTAPLPLRDVYWLVRANRRRGVAIEAQAPDPQLLLGATFISSVREPRRLLAQLEMTSALARTVALHRVLVGRDTDAGAVAAAILADTGRRT